MNGLPEEILRCFRADFTEHLTYEELQHLHLLNGRKVQSRDFFKTADGRVMLTQARATLTSDQRNGLTLGNSLNKKYYSKRIPRRIWRKVAASI